MPGTLTGIVPDVVAEQYGDVQYRAAASLELLDGDKREIQLRAVPYEVEARLGEHLYESFERGAFGRASKDPGRVKLWLGHSTDGGRIVGQAYDVENRADGLWLSTRVSKTPAGDELLTLAQDGVLDEASIEFAPIRESMLVRQRGEDVVVRHRRAHLRGVALVPHGAYGRDALVASVRDDSSKAREEWLARLRQRTA